MKFTKYEEARIIGARALQVAMGAPILVALTKPELEKMKYSPIEIAKKEFYTNVLPITIKRPLPTKLA
ncbi:MAG: DNA-directed RNA polymerase subunit K [Nanoarchaeota archaeon]